MRSAARRRNAGRVLRRQPVADPRRMLDLGQLDALEKRLVWECLKRRRPALAELLQDPQLHALAAAFNGRIQIELD